MTQAFADALSWVPKSTGLGTTLMRAFEYAKAQSHRAVTLEHVLLALTSDLDAGAVFQACGLDAANLTTALSDHLGRLDDRLAPGETGDPVAAPDLIRILDYAAAAARQSRRREVNGAVVLAAIVGEGKSAAAHLLRGQGLTFEETIKALQRANTPSRQLAAPAQAQPLEVPRAPEHDEFSASEERRPEPPFSPGQYAGTRGGNGGPAIQASEPGQASHSERGQRGEAGPRRRPSAPHELGRAAQEGVVPAREQMRRGPELAPSGLDVAPPARPQPDARPSHDGPGPYANGRAGLAARHPPPSPLPPPAPAPARWPDVLPPARPHGYDGSMRPGSTASTSSAPLPLEDLIRETQQAALDRVRPQPGQALPPLANPAQLGTGREARTHAQPGSLVENIPRNMRVGIGSTIEVRIARADIDLLKRGMAGPGAPVEHAISVTKAMSVQLRAPEGAFFIETVSPETQWVEDRIALAAGDFASWKWTVTPRRSGRARIQLVVAARIVGANGLTADMALPEQVVDVTIDANYGKAFARMGGWIVAAIAGGVLARFGEGAFETVLSMLSGV